MFVEYQIAADDKCATVDHESRKAFRDAMRRFATTVSIISCSRDGCRYGMSATAVSSLSFDPPALLVCVNSSAATHRALSRGGRFCVNVLRSFHSGLSQTFSGKFRGEDRFAVGQWGQTADGLPFLLDAQSNLFCEIDRTIKYATHTIFIGQVYAAMTQTEVDPLVYQDGKYVVTQPLEGERRE
jgi:flavin reductase (DIM6/NTAB) family NADH-FMN oxidoreductase RutF